MANGSRRKYTLRIVRCSSVPTMACPPWLFFGPGEHSAGGAGAKDYLGEFAPDADAHHENGAEQRHDHDLDVGGTAGGEQGMVHGKANRCTPARPERALTPAVPPTSRS